MKRMETFETGETGETITTLVDGETFDVPQVNLEIRPKTIDFKYALAMIIGNIVGSGIYTSVSPSYKAFEEGKPSGMVLVFWLSAGLVSMGGALCYAELGTRIRESGGERAYFSQIISIKLARVFVIFNVFIIKTLTVAGLCTASGEYIFRIFRPDQEEVNTTIVQIISLIILVICVILNCISKKVALKAGAICTVLKSLAMVIIIMCGFIYICKGKALDWDKPFTFSVIKIDGIINLYIALFWSYDGWNSPGSTVGDMKNPTRDLPRAIIGGVTVVTVLYVLTVASYTTVLGYEKSGKSLTIAASFATEALGRAAPIIPLLVICSIVGAVIGCLFGISSISSSAGYSGELPRIFSLVHKRTRTPIFSLICIGLISAAFTFLDFVTIMDYCAFLSWIFYFATFCALWKIKLETRHKVIEGVFEVPYVVIIPIQLVCILIVVTSFKEKYISCTIFLCALILSIAVQYVPSRYTHLPFLIQAHDSAIKSLSVIQLEPGRSSDFS